MSLAPSLAKSSLSTGVPWRSSVLALSGSTRAGLALLVLAVLWLAVAWAVAIP